MKLFAWKITELRGADGSGYGYISIWVWDNFKGFGGLTIDAGEDVYISPYGESYIDEVDDSIREHRLVRNYWRSIGSPHRNFDSEGRLVADTWFPWKAAKLTPQDAGKAWKVANFCPGEAAEAWPASGFTLDELKEAWKVAEFSPATATVRRLEEGVY
jgi:hypothetical protein